MNDELSYAEMLEIPVETVTVSRREKKRKKQEDLSEQLLDKVNERVSADDPAYTESTEISRAPKKKKGKAHTVLVVEFAVVVLLSKIAQPEKFPDACTAWEGGVRR